MQALDGVYLQFEPIMLEPTGQSRLRELCERCTTCTCMGTACTMHGYSMHMHRYSMHVHGHSSHLQMIHMIHMGMHGTEPPALNYDAPYYSGV